VLFDFTGAGVQHRYSWTEPNADDGFLVLDIDENGRIDHGGEMFGNTMWIGSRLAENGFDALAWYDLPANGGNGDQRFSAADSVFARVRLWFDRNHDGVSEPDELESLDARDVKEIDLNFMTVGKRDSQGNLFRFKSRVEFGVTPHGVGRFVYDVFLVRRREQ
jgi:hypothetical protein